MKVRWLVAIALYAAACAGALFVRYPSPVAKLPNSDWDLLREFVTAADVIDALRLCWMPALLILTAAVWFSARRRIRPGHTEISVALGSAAVAFPFVSFPEPDCPSLCTVGYPSLWIGSSAAAFVLIFSGVLGWRAFTRVREELRMVDSQIRIT